MKNRLTELLARLGRKKPAPPAAPPPETNLPDWLLDPANLAEPFGNRFSKKE